MSNIANTIAEQIGSRAFFMMGASGLVGDETSLTFKIKGSKIKCINITLDPTDTYTVTFYVGRGLNVREFSKISDVYADSLRSVIESNTGLYLSL